MKASRCGCSCSCANEIKADWLKCRPCALGWHNPKPCEDPSADRHWPIVTTCALCGYELTKDGLAHARR
jgi:hypothetical protein